MHQAKRKETSSSNIVEIYTHTRRSRAAVAAAAAAAVEVKRNKRWDSVGGKVIAFSNVQVSLIGRKDAPSKKEKKTSSSNIVEIYTHAQKQSSSSRG